MQFQKKRCVAMLLAGGQGSRLMVLTENTAKPAVPFGGKYRIIDFPLSNCVNSKIDTVGILTQYQPLELNEYIGNGQPWGLNSSHGGVQVLPPYAKSKNSEWYKGTANAIFQNIGFVDMYDPEYVLILSGDRELEMLGRYEENAYFWRMMRIVGHPDVRLLEFDGYDHGNMPEAGHPVALRYIREMLRKAER